MWPPLLTSYLSLLRVAFKVPLVRITLTATQAKNPELVAKALEFELEGVPYHVPRYSRLRDADSVEGVASSAQMIHTNLQVRPML